MNIASGSARWGAGGEISHRFVPHCCPGGEGGGEAMRDRRHNEKSGGHQICSPGIVQLAEGWETGAKMGNRGLGIGKQREEKIQDNTGGHQTGIK